MRISPEVRASAFVIARAIASKESFERYLAKAEGIMRSIHIKKK
jgi:hypothetical protein